MQRATALDQQFFPILFGTSFAFPFLVCSHALAGHCRPQKKHVECAELLLGSGTELTTFVARLMDDIGNLKAMLQAISIGVRCAVVLQNSAIIQRYCCSNTAP